MKVCLFRAASLFKSRFVFSTTKKVEIVKETIFPSVSQRVAFRDEEETSCGRRRRLSLRLLHFGPPTG